MSDKRANFPVLEDFSSQAGLPLHNAVEGETVTSKNALAAFTAKDNGGDFKYLEIDEFGQLKVTNDGDERACISDEGGAEANTSTFTDLVTLVGAINKTYDRIEIVGSGFRDTILEAVLIDDVGVSDVETILATFRVGSGQFSKCLDLTCRKVTAGGTGIINIVLRAKISFGPDSDVDGVLAVSEIQ